MTTKNSPSLLISLVGGAATVLAGSVLTGCAPPIETSPVVTITVPSANQVLPAGKPIDVRFTVGGLDESGGTPVQFRLVGGDMRVPGQGQVRAFLSSGGFLARTFSIPNDSAPFLVPDGVYGTAEALVTPGPKKLTLHLYYNDSENGNTEVSPQREGVVNITIQ